MVTDSDEKEGSILRTPWMRRPQAHIPYQPIGLRNQELVVVVQNVRVTAQTLVNGDLDRKSCFAINVPNPPVTAPI